MKATFTFVGGLNDFLSHHHKDTTFSLEFAAHQTLKHLIESIGVPHTEFGRVQVNGQAVDIQQPFAGGRPGDGLPGGLLAGG